jgi:hypothetical protein
MFVCKGARAKLLKQRHSEFFDDYVYPLVNEAKRLEIGSPELKIMIERGYQ